MVQFYLLEGFSFDKTLKEPEGPTWLRRCGCMTPSSYGCKGEVVPISLGPSSNVKSQISDKFVLKVGMKI
jgi:hypothetical protein